MSITDEEIDASISLITVYKYRVDLLKKVYDEVIKNDSSVMEEIHSVLRELILCVDHSSKMFLITTEKVLNAKFLEKLLNYEFEISGRLLYQKLSDKLQKHINMAEPWQ